MSTKYFKARLAKLDEQLADDLRIRQDLELVDNCGRVVDNWEAQFIEVHAFRKGLMTTAQRVKAKQIVERYL